MVTVAEMLEAIKRAKWPLGRHPNICDTIFISEPLAKSVILLHLFLGSAGLEALISKGGILTPETQQFKLVADTTFLPF